MNGEQTFASRPPPMSKTLDNGITVRPVASKRDRTDFVKFPWQIYQNDPLWVPPLVLERLEYIDPRKHPFYAHGSAVPLLAYQGERIVGRILVSDDPNYNRQHQSNAGCFGMFESVNDQAVADALLDAAADWLRQRGRTELLGPIDYSTNYASGLLIHGFHMPPRIMMNHNPPYYMELLENWGLQKAKDLFAWWFVDSKDMLNKWSARSNRLKERGAITIRPFRVKDFEAEVARCKALYNQAWQNNWGFVPMTDEEFDHLGQNLRRFARPELLLLAEVEGEAVGFSMTLPDLNEAIRPLNGRIFRFGLPIGLFRLRRNYKRIRTARLVTMGVLDKYRRRGVAELLILKTLECGKLDMHYTSAELGWTLEDNHLINRTIEAVGAEQYKTYRIYQKRLA